MVTFRIGHLYKGRSGEQNANIDIKGEAQWKNFLLFFLLFFVFLRRTVYLSDISGDGGRCDGETTCWRCHPQCGCPGIEKSWTAAQIIWKDDLKAKRIESTTPKMLMMMRRKMMNRSRRKKMLMMLIMIAVRTCGRRLTTMLCGCWRIPAAK